jgi:hypothetical protein
VTVHPERASYHSYLLRLWATEEQGQLLWRASLENPHTGERLGFATLEHLFTFLQDQEKEWTRGRGQRPDAV